MSSMESWRQFMSLTEMTNQVFFILEGFIIASVYVKICRKAFLNYDAVNNQTWWVICRLVGWSVDVLPILFQHEFWSMRAIKTQTKFYQSSRYFIEMSLWNVLLQYSFFVIFHLLLCSIATMLRSNFTMWYQHACILCANFIM